MRDYHRLHESSGTFRGLPTTEEVDSWREKQWVDFILPCFIDTDIDADRDVTLSQRMSFFEEYFKEYFETFDLPFYECFWFWEQLGRRSPPPVVMLNPMNIVRHATLYLDRSDIDDDRSHYPLLENFTEESVKLYETQLKKALKDTINVKSGKGKTLYTVCDELITRIEEGGGGEGEGEGGGEGNTTKNQRRNRRRKARTVKRRLIDDAVGYAAQHIVSELIEEGTRQAEVEDKVLNDVSSRTIDDLVEQEALHVREMLPITLLAYQFEDTLSCPITHELFDEPVVASDGITYERRKIEEWLELKKDAGEIAYPPLGGEEPLKDEVYPNTTLLRFVKLYRSIYDD